MKQSTTRPKELGLIGLCFWLGLRWVGWCIFGWFTALLITLVLLVWLGPTLGLWFIQQLLLKQLLLCQHLLSGWIFLRELLDLAIALTHQLFQIGHLKTQSLLTLAPLKSSLGHLPIQPFLKLKLTHLSALLEFYWRALLATTAIVVLRLVIALHEMVLFFIFGCMGLIDGLVLRDLRRLGGGRESALIYHRVKKCLSPLICGASFLYLIIPWAIQPELLFVPFAMCFGLAITFTAKTFKKYL